MAAEPRPFDNNCSGGSTSTLERVARSAALRIVGEILYNWESSAKGHSSAMPSLIRFLVVCAILVGAVYGGMFALATMVEPQPREMTVKIPAKRINP